MKKLTLKQATQNVRNRMYVVNTKEGKEEAERELQALIQAAKDEQTIDILAMLKRVTIDEAIQPPSQPIQKEPCPTCAEVVRFFNELTGMNCLLVGQVVGHIHQRHLQYGLESCKNVSKFKYEEWKSDPHMLGSINLLTFFRPSNFDRYYNQMNFRKASGQDQAPLPAGDMES